MIPVVPVGSVAHPAHSSPLPSFDLVIFGGSGDLALRKLLPALFHRYRDGQIVDGWNLVDESAMAKGIAAARTAQ